jgi:hypothetical protein
MRATQRMTVPVHAIRLNDARDALRAGRHRDDQDAADTAEIKLGEAATVKLGPLGSMRWRSLDLDFREDIKRQARATARATGRSVQLRTADGVLVYTAQSHAHR